MYFSSCFLSFQNIYVTRIFSLMSFPTDVFHAFTEMGDCVGVSNLIDPRDDKTPLDNLFGPWPRPTCDAEKALTMACSAFPSSSSFSSAQEMLVDVSYAAP
jgi:hypothetical protein